MKKIPVRKILFALVMVIPMTMSFCVVFGTFILFITGPIALLPRPDFLKWENNVKISEDVFKENITLQVITEEVQPLQVKIVSLKNNISKNLALQTNQLVRLGKELEAGKYRLEVRYGEEEEFFEIEKIK